MVKLKKRLEIVYFLGGSKISDESRARAIRLKNKHRLVEAYPETGTPNPKIVFVDCKFGRPCPGFVLSGYFRKCELCGHNHRFRIQPCVECEWIGGAYGSFHCKRCGNKPTKKQTIQSKLVGFLI